MVKRELKTSALEDDGISGILNENGKRVSDTQIKDGPKRIKTKSLYRQPTVQELNRLQETENLFNSNLFRLQIDEVLQEVKLKEKTEKKFIEWFSQLKNYLLTIPNDDIEYDLTESTLTKKLKVKLPIPDELNKTKCMFKFQKFKDVEIVGSYTLGCVISSKLIFNVQITAPADTYTKNDSINYRYHKKRAAYLAYIASYLLSTELIEELQYTTINGCRTKPVLNLKPTGKLGNHLTVRLDIVCEQEAYKLHRFSPSRNNLRESWLFDTKESTTEIGPPTPYYNSSVLHDLTATANKEFLNNVLSKCDNLKQAIVLLKIWLRQRDLKVSGHIVSLFVAYFVQIKRINNVMSSYQIVRNIWIALKSLELDKKGISLYKGADSPPLDDFHQHFPVVFLDVTGYYNICWSMCKGTYQALKREAGIAVEMLDNNKINSFILLFMTPVKPLLQFDHILRFKDVKELKNSIISKTSKQSRLNYGLDTLALTTDTLHTLLTKGLGKRAELILQIVDADFSWSIKKKMGKALDECVEKLSFGFVLNAEHATNTVEKGPPANLPEAEQFRLFWGEKSELRRFQDGSITETVVWRGRSAVESRTVTTQILNYLMKLKYDIAPSSLFHISHQFESLLMCPHESGTEDIQNVEELSTRVVTTFDELRRDLRGLVDLPLDVSTCNGVSSVFSYSAPVPPSATACPPGAWRRGGTCLVKDKRGARDVPQYVPVSRAVLELGYSGKWPGDINAFRCLKTAFHLQIAQQLTKQYSLGTQAYPNHVDVIKNGLVFRVSIVHPKEVTLLRKEVENGVAKYRDSEESLELFREGFVVPRLRGAMHGLHQKHLSFGPTCSLFKRWLSAHFLSSPHMPSPLPEALCARVFLQSAPVTPPLVPTLGLVRVWQMLVATDWDSDVVVLDFNDDLTAQELSSIERSVSHLGKPPMCVVTRSEPTWSPLPSPVSQVRSRLVALAAAALQYVEKELDACTENILAAFVPSLSGYDVLIHLDPSLVPPKGSNVNGSTDTDDDVIPVVDFNVVRKYLDELRIAYEDFALFFNDRYGGEVIAVLWKPDINDYKEFQSLNAHALTPVKDGSSTKYKVNIPAIIEDFKTMGAGLVKNITLQ